MIYDLNLIYCSQNFDNELNFSLLSPPGTSAREINLLVVFILIEYSILLKDLELREIKFSKDVNLGVSSQYNE